MDITFRVGTSGIQQWFKPKEEIIETLVPPGESVLIKTGMAIELPPGTYGRIAPRSSLAIRGIETGAGVVDRDFRGEVKVLLRNWSDEDHRVYKGDRVAQLVVERILEVGVHHVENLSETTWGNRGFGYSAHEEAYPWADPDDPLYQRQEPGARNPVERFSLRTMHQEPQGHSRAPQVPDPDLWHRGHYDPEAERKRRASLGLGMSAWDRMMERRGPRKNFGGRGS